MNKIICAIIAIILIISISLLPWSTTHTRLKRVFKLNGSNNISNNDIKNQLLKKFPNGQSKDEIESYLKKNYFFIDTRNYTIEEDKDDGTSEMRVGITGPAVYELVHRNYVVVFVFDEKSNLLDIRVGYGLTGL